MNGFFFLLYYELYFLVNSVLAIFLLRVAMCPFSGELFGIACSHLPCMMACRGLGSILLSPMPYIYAVNLEQVPSFCSLNIFSLHYQLTWKTLPDSSNLRRSLLCPLEFVGHLYYNTFESSWNHWFNLLSFLLASELHDNEDFVIFICCPTYHNVWLWWSFWEPQFMRCWLRFWEY